MMPKISVLMPVYNCELYIFEAIDSILKQSYPEFELLIIDDYSTDSTLQMCKSFDDPRIIIIEKAENTGYTNSLNYGLSIAKGEYIARMDGDDISLPTRFAKQIAFLEANPTVSLCGTAFRFLGSDKIVKHPLNHEEIKVKLCFSTAFCHPSIMARKEIFTSNFYDKNFEPAEDYELWSRLAFQSNLANLSEVLLLYRIHENQVSNEKNTIQQFNSFLIRKNIFKKLLPNVIVESEDFKLFLAFSPVDSIEDCKKIMNLSPVIVDANQSKKMFSNVLFYNRIHAHRNTLIRSYITKQVFFKPRTICFIITNLSIIEFFRIFIFKKRK